MADDADFSETQNSPESVLSHFEESMFKFDYLTLIKLLNEDSKDFINSITDDLGRTALHYASLATNPENVMTLLKYGASVNIVDKDGMSPFLNAVTMGYKEIVTPILESNPNIHTIHKPTGNTALHIAALNWNAIIAETLIDKGVKINQQNNKGLTALHIAVDQRDLTMMELLLERGAKLNNLDKKGETALYKAVVIGDHRLVKLLINKGSFLNTQKQSTKQLHRTAVDASSSSYTEPVVGNSPLHVAVNSGYVTIVDLLLYYLAWIDVKDDRGLTPLQCAVECGNNTIVKRLIEKGAAVVDIREWLVDKCQKDVNDQVKLTIMTHMIKLKILNMFSANVVLGDTNRISELECKCFSELSKSKSYHLLNGVVFDVFHPNLSLAKPSEIEQLKRALDSPEMASEFPLYISVLRATVAQIKMRSLLVSKGFLFFAILFKLNPIHRVLPRSAMLIIFKSLSNVDLQNILVFCENSMDKKIK